MAPPLLRLEDVSLTFGGQPLLESVTFSVHSGNRMALVGRNGSGKSTLLKIAAGLAEQTGGIVYRDPKATVRYLPQEPDFGSVATIRDYALAGLGPADDPYRVDYLLDELGLDGSRAPIGLSGGEARRAALVKTLAPQPDILLLDEPTNHLDLPAIEWLEGELSRSSAALLLISHDRRFLETLSRSTLWLDRGVVRENGEGYGSFEAWRDRVLEEEERDLHKLERKIEREEHWLRYGVTARRKRNVRRLDSLHALRKDFREHRRADGVVRMAASDAQASGKLVIEATGLAKSLGDRTLVRDFSIRIHRGDRIGLVGPNGAGKTTLVRLLTDRLEPDAGALRHGVNLDIAALDQNRSFDPEETLEHFLTDGRGQTLVVNGEQKHVASYMKDFLFRPEQARTPVRNLSGGERARLLLARLLARPANMLVLDEPTNDLDIETLDLLQELVADFPGTVLLVSHDRDFLDRTVNAVIASEGDGRWTVFAGGYSDMLSQRRAAPVSERSRAEPGRQSGPAAQRTAEPARAKLSYKQKYALETLPARIEALGQEIAALEAKLADPALFARDPKAFNTAATQAGTKREQLVALEDEWLALEMLREELEA